MRIIIIDPGLNSSRLIICCFPAAGPGNVDAAACRTILERRIRFHGTDPGGFCTRSDNLSLQHGPSCTAAAQENQTCCGWFCRTFSVDQDLLESNSQNRTRIQTAQWPSQSPDLLHVSAGFIEQNVLQNRIPPPEPGCF